MKASLSREALGDAKAAADWYRDQGSPQAAGRFKEQLGSTLALLCEHPELGTPLAHSLRSFPIRQFPLSVVYRVDGDHLRVIAVAAHRRRPGYWKGRR